MGYDPQAHLVYGIELTDQEAESLDIEDAADSLNLDIGYVGDSRSGMTPYLIGLGQKTQGRFTVKVKVYLSPTEKEEIQERIRQFCTQLNIPIRESDWYMSECII